MSRQAVGSWLGAAVALWVAAGSVGSGVDPATGSPTAVRTVWMAARPASRAASPAATHRATSIQGRLMRDMVPAGPLRPGQGPPKGGLSRGAGGAECRRGPACCPSVGEVAGLLIVEDDARIRTALVRALDERGHAVASAPDGLSALRELARVAPDLVVLDLGLPDVDGIELLRMLRAVNTVPVIVATARDDDPSIVRALDAGADDYLIKPFSAEQLDARIRAVLRRAATPEADAALVVGPLTVDVRGRTATLDGRTLELSPKEFDLLAYLAARPGTVVTKRELLREVWQSAYGGADKTVDVHLSWLRRKLGETAQEPRFIASVRGVGVKLVEPSP